MTVIVLWLFPTVPWVDQKPVVVIILNSFCGQNPSTDSEDCVDKIGGGQGTHLCTIPTVL